MQGPRTNDGARRAIVNGRWVLQTAFGRWHGVGCTWIAGQGGTHGARKCLEDRLGLVMGIFALQVIDVEGDPCMVNESLEELKRQLGIKSAHHAAFKRYIHV